MIAPKSYTEQSSATDKMILAHVDLVRRLAWHFQGRVGRFIEIDDLIQAGYLGLVDAAQRYCVQEGVSFAAYAAIRVRGSIIDHLRRNSNLCRNTITMRQKIEKARARLAQQLGHEPDTLAIAQELAITPVELQDWMNKFQVNQLESLDDVYTDHSLAFSSEMTSAEDAVEQRQMKALLRIALEDLPEREALVLQLYYVEEMNVYEIAAILGVTTGRVSQIKKAAVTRLRDSITARLEQTA